MKEVADLLHVTARTAAFHKYMIMEQPDMKTSGPVDAICPRSWNVEKAQLVFVRVPVSFDSIGDSQQCL